MSDAKESETVEAGAMRRAGSAPVSSASAREGDPHALIDKFHGSGAGTIATPTAWLRPRHFKSGERTPARRSIAPPGVVQERARALELTGDPRAAEPYVLAELHGLAGHFFADGPVVEYAEVPEIQNLDLNWQELRP